MNTTVRLGVVMDPIAGINIKKDSTFAMLLAAQARGWPLFYMEQGDLFLADGRVHASMRPLSVRDDPNGWFTLGEPETLPLASLDTVLMRKDPPLDLEYFYSTYLLELAEREGCLIVNRPQAVRDANEKLFAAWFPDCCPPLLVTRDMARIRAFLNAQGDIVVKPLDGMGGASVFRLRQNDPNTGVILETSTDHGRRTVMAQRFLPEYVDGDKRILLIDGEPVPQALARIPAAGESRANLAAGGTGVGVDLTERDRFICAQVGPVLRDKGLLFVGIDVIGDYLTEINVTSPTCIRELDKIYGLDIAGTLMDAIARRLGR
ncbi:MAG: glutathione synthase [Ectothiorhodospiraceae bacterium]|jgi:glutathione synthase|nr:glutathione synthase [Ectothiorhodospiraceae bacterium]